MYVEKKDIFSFFFFQDINQLASHFQSVQNAPQYEPIQREKTVL
jgi:hypothetical protein